MKRRCVVIAVGLWVLSVSAVNAQTAPPDVVRPDISGTIGWLNVNKNDLSSYNDWYNRGVLGSLTLGWHWSVHLKTEVEAAASTRVEFYGSSDEFINGVRAHVNSEHGFQTRRVALSQQYQFGENAWFHPHLAAGVDFNWERTSRVDREVFFYDFTVRQNIFLRQPVVHSPRTDLHARPFVAAGFKSYMTPRSFFRSDLRIVAGKRIEEVILRFGFGADF